jgi:hypothetical protein
MQSPRTKPAFTCINAGSANVHLEAGYYSWETAGQDHGNGAVFPLAFRAEARL